MIHRVGCVVCLKVNEFMRDNAPMIEAGRGAETPPAPAMVVLTPADLDATLVLPDDPGFLLPFAQCMKGWAFSSQRLAEGALPITPPMIVIEPREKGLYRAHSRFLDEPLDGLPLAAAICAVLADLSQAASEEGGPSHFALHCAGVILGARGVILAGERRAGKSTLVARLSAETDVRILGDDVLPLRADAMMQGLGLAPRLRMPLPDAASPAFRAHVARCLGPADDRYGYLLTPALQPLGTRARAEAFILLDRRPGVTAALHHLPQDRLLRALIDRSIAGPEDAGAVYDLAFGLASRLVGLRLVYSDLEQAAQLLRTAFAPDGRPVAETITLQPDLPDVPPEPAVAPPPPFNALVQRRPGTATRRIGDAAFLWHPEEAMIWHLNPVAHLIWTFLSRPATADRLAKRLNRLFPDQPLERLQADTGHLLGRMMADGLVLRHAGTVSSDSRGKSD